MKYILCREILDTEMLLITIINEHIDYHYWFPDISMQCVVHRQYNRTVKLWMLGNDSMLKDILLINKPDCSTGILECDDESTCSLRRK